MKNFGYVKAAALVPQISIAEPMRNARYIIAMAESCDADVLVFPELSVTGFTCGDLFYQRTLLDSAEEALAEIARASAEMHGKLLAVGAPVRCGSRLYTCAVLIANGEILGAVPKSFVSAVGELSQARWFAPASMLSESEVTVAGYTVPIGTDLLFREAGGRLVLGAELGEDLLAVNPPSGRLALGGANLVINLSAGSGAVTASEYRRSLVSVQSARCVCGYVMASAGTDESSSDAVFSGHCIICDSGTVLAESEYRNGEICAAVDLECIDSDRLRCNAFSSDGTAFRLVGFEGGRVQRLPETVSAYPFIPTDPTERLRRCRDVIRLQASGLASRLKKTGIKRVVIGISGGVDSTLALIAAVEAFALLGLSPEGITAITMPGFGTTDRTLGNALELIEKLGASARTISIADACLQHFADIGQDPERHDVVYENTQARERTQILMDVANMENALVIGTGDLSELALGWCTFNGDHMSMYSVNCAIPKTLAKYVIHGYGEMNPEFAPVLEAILDTPISPELLPADESGRIAQKTEEKLGKYDIHDFILFHVLRSGFAPEKIFALARIAFPAVESSELKDTMLTFYRRFFSQQFKRNCVPDGVGIGSVGLSPRGAWQMPSEASAKLWLSAVAKLPNEE